MQLKQIIDIIKSTLVSLSDNPATWSVDEGPSWKASDSGEGSAEESEFEDEDQ